MESRVHHLRSFVFSRSLNINAVSQAIAGSQSSIDPRAAVRTKVGAGGYIFLFNYGSIVFWDVADEEQASYLSRLMGISDIPNLQPRFSDTFTVVEEHGPTQVEFNKLIIEHLNLDRMEVIASTLAQSTSMEYYESLVEESWQQVDSLLGQLRRRGTLNMMSSPVNKEIAASLSLRSTVIRVLHLLDKPDLIWEDKTMDEIYGDLRAMFDLPERFQALEYKLQLIQQTLSVVVETIRDRRLYWLEVAIVLLILFEIVMSFVR
jgi:uncharacterized Rmd1/YagE family protein